MSQLNIKRTLKLSDDKVVKLFKAIEKKFGSQSSGLHIGATTLNLLDVDDWKAIKSSKNYSVTRGDFVLEGGSAIIRYRKGVCSNQKQYEETRKASSHFDEVIIEHRAQMDVKEAIALDSLVDSNINLVKSADTSETEGKVTDLLHAQMANLSSQYQDMMTGIDKRRAELDKEHSAKQKELETEYAKRFENLKKKEDKSRENINLEKEKLEEVKKTLDDREYMHVRRNLRENINQEIKDRLQRTIVSAGASLKSIIILLLSLGATVALGYYSYSAFLEFSKLIGQSNISINIDGGVTDTSYSNSSTLVWLLFLKATVSSMGAVAFLAYALKWLQKLYYEDVNAERDLENYAYDINRASWAIETIMEMHNTKSMAPPDIWINAVCKNLFNKDGVQDSKDIEPTPLETLLGASAKAEFGPEGPKFEVNKKGVRQLAKAVSND